MAITGSNFSASTSETAARAGEVVIGIPAGPGRDDAAGALSRALVTAAGRSDATVVIARPGSPGREERSRTDDGAVEVHYTPRPQDALDIPYHGIPGRARAIHAIFAEARAAEAGGCIVVDPRTTGPLDWVEGFVRALTDHEADFVAPLYSRHPFSSGLVHGLLAPLFAALYGVRIAYPVAAHFACSSRLINTVVADPIWDTAAAQVGLDWWLATAAAAGNLRVVQTPIAASLGDDKPLVDLSTTTVQLVGFAFADLERQVRVWQRVRGSRAVTRIGDQAPPSVAAPRIDPAALTESFRSAFRDLREVWEEVLPPLSIIQWRRLSTIPLDSFSVDDAVWARTVYDFAMGHRLRVLPRGDLLRALTPLYLAWLASFVLEQRGGTTEAMEARLARLGSAFEQEKRYLIAQWRWPERFKPVKLRR